MKPMKQQYLLTIATAVECLAGLALLLAPGAACALLFGEEPDSVGLTIARVAGVALLSLGIACWGARRDVGGAAQTGTLRAITLYNAGAGLLLFGFAATGSTGGMVAWGAGAVHLILALGFAGSLMAVAHTASAQ